MMDRPGTVFPCFSGEEQTIRSQNKQKEQQTSGARKSGQYISFSRDNALQVITPPPRTDAGLHPAGGRCPLVSGGGTAARSLKFQD